MKPTTKFSLLSLFSLSLSLSLFLSRTYHPPTRWLQIVQRTRTLSIAGSTLGRKETLWVATISIVFGGTFIGLGVVGDPSTTLIIAAVLHVVAIVIYLIAAHKLVGIIGNGNTAGRRITTLTRRLAYCFIATIITSVIYTIIAGGKATFPLEILVTNLFMPLSYSSSHTLFFSFVNESLGRDRAASRRNSGEASAGTPVGTPVNSPNSGNRAGLKSPVSVAPAPGTKWGNESPSAWDKDPTRTAAEKVDNATTVSSSALNTGGKQSKTNRTTTSGSAWSEASIYRESGGTGRLSSRGSSGSASVSLKTTVQ